MFQSAPLTEARGDLGNLSRCGSPSTRFNPLPLPKQGETFHDDLWHPGDKRFNPLPLPKQGETDPIPEQHTDRLSFNPLPLPKQGETRHPSEAFSVLTKGISFQSAPLTEARGARVEYRHVSIRSPYRSKGRPKHKASERVIRASVSIRSPYRSKGRPVGYLQLFNLNFTSFQSAPLTEARGDFRTLSTPSDGCRRFNPLPLPKQGETGVGGFYRLVSD